MLTLTTAQRRTAPAEIPDKLYFRIGDVARICEVPAYVLRFWETEFPQLKPNKSGTGQRLYRKRDVELALRIKRLLYDEGYTIPGARQVFQAEAKEVRGVGKKSVAAETALPTAISTSAAPGIEAGVGTGIGAGLDAARRELRSLAALLAAPVQPAPPRRAAGRVVERKAGSLFEL